MAEVSFEDGSIFRMMYDVAQARIRTALERTGTAPDFTTFPASWRTALEEEVGEKPLKKLTILGVRIEWREGR